MPGTQTETRVARRVECPACGHKAKRVSTFTLGALLKDKFAEPFTVNGHSCCSSNGDGCHPVTGWRFCDSPGCDVVYFSEEGDTRFAKSQLKVAVGVKETTGKRPLCYCFGHSVASIKDEFHAKGRSDALDDIRAKMKTPGCRCETENPSGACCLGNVTNGIQIAHEELEMSGSDAKAPATLDKPSTPSQPSTSRGEKIAKVGTVLSAIVASSCCWLPLVLLAVGASGAGIAATMEAYRPLFIVVTFGFLAVAFYFTYRPRKVTDDEDHACCAPETMEGIKAMAACCTPPGRRRFSMLAMNEGMLWVVTMLAVAFLLFPSYVGLLFGTGNGAVVTENMNRAVFAIDGMTCEGCATTVAQAIRRVPGVVAVEVSYEKGQAMIGAEACCLVPKEQILAALKKSGYSGTLLDDVASHSTVTLGVEGMSCPACAVSVRSALTKLSGVESATVDLKTGEVLVHFDADKVKPEEMAQAVTDSGFQSRVKPSKN